MLSLRDYFITFISFDSRLFNWPINEEKNIKYNYTYFVMFSW